MKYLALVSIFLIKQMLACTQTTVKVNNVQDLYNSIASNTTIILAPGDYHLEKIDTTKKNPVCNWSLVLFDEIYANEPNDEDKTLLIEGIQNLTITTTGKDSVRILTNRTAASVMAFKTCANINLQGIIFGHDIVKDKQPGNYYISFCSGEVLEFFDCSAVSIKSSVLFGCGTRGFLAHRCKGIILEKTVIKDCSYGLFGVFDCENISFKKCNFYYSMYELLFEITGCKNLTAKKTAIHNCVFSNYGQREVKMELSENIHIEQIKIKKMNFKKEYKKMVEEFNQYGP